LSIFTDPDPVSSDSVHSSPTATHPTNHAFDTSWDEGRIIRTDPDSIGTTDTQPDFYSFHQNDLPNYSQIYQISTKNINENDYDDNNNFHFEGIHLSFRSFAGTNTYNSVDLEPTEIKYHCPIILIIFK
jgi:hypothetical protein